MALDAFGRVGMWRGGIRLNISVAAPFVWRCLSGLAVLRFHIPLIEPGLVDLPHPALGQDLTPSPTARRAQAGTGVRVRSARKGAGVDKSRPCVA
jgi:transposase